MNVSWKGYEAISSVEELPEAHGMPSRTSF